MTRSRILQLAMGLTLAGAVASPAADVLLRDRVQAAGSIVRLGDVATIATPDEALKRRLEALALMPTPAPGEHTYLSAAATRDLLKAQGIDLVELRFGGATKSEVLGPTAPEGVLAGEEPRQTSASTVGWRSRPARSSGPAALVTGFRAPPGSFPTPSRPVESRPAIDTPSPPATPKRPSAWDRRAAIQRATQAIAAWTRAAGSAAIEVLRVDAEESAIVDLVAWGEGPLAVAPIGDDPLTAGERRFRLQPGEANQTGEVEVVAELDELPIVVAARLPIDKGALVTASHVELRPLPRDQRHLSAGAFTALGQALGKEALQTIAPGAPLGEKNCASPLLVRRGEPVSVVTSTEGVRVRMQGVAKSDGRAGDYVAINAEGRRDPLTARVIGPRELAVLGGESLGGRLGPEAPAPGAAAGDPGYAAPYGFGSGSPPVSAPLGGFR